MSHDSGRIRALAFHPEGEVILTGGFDNTARFWNAKTGEPIGPPLEHNRPVSAMAFSPDGKTALTASQPNGIDGVFPESTAQLWTTTPEHRLLLTVRHSSTIRGVAFSPDGKRFATASQDWTARIWETATGRLLAPPLRHRSYVLGVAFSPDGRHVLTSESGAARLWRANAARASREGKTSQAEFLLASLGGQAFPGRQLL
jgi:WD40 repeat protein